MIDLSTNYLSMTLNTPLVPPRLLCRKKSKPFGALRMRVHPPWYCIPFFEEQLRQESYELDHHLTAGTESFAEATSFFS